MGYHYTVTKADPNTYEIQLNGVGIYQEYGDLTLILPEQDVTDPEKVFNDNYLMHV